jgi:predicted membrane protein
VGDFRIIDTTSRLIELDRTGSQGKYNMTSEDSDSSRTIRLSLEKAEFKGEMKNSIKMKLNPLPIWDLELNVGAAEVNFDLSPYKTRNISIQGGASNVEVKLGSSFPDSDVNIEAGAASITLQVPKDAGCEITSNTFLASKNFEGFNKVDSHHYQTDGYSTAVKKIHINLEAGMADIEVVRY